MKLCYALRRGVFYPSARDAFGEMPPYAHRSAYLAHVGRLGFDGLELPVDEAADAPATRSLAGELRDAGLPGVCVRAGGDLAHPLAGPAARRRLEQAIQYASWLGASVVNTAMVSPPTHPGGPGHARQGEQVSQGASRTASEADFERAAKWLNHYGRMAADLGIDIAIEVHQGSIADNSTATLHLLDLVGLDNVGANPDLGNIYWHYEQPEETAEQAIVALARRVPLPDGELDYRFAIAAMLDAGYTGYVAIEGAREGDQLSQDARSADYARTLLRDLAGD